ncbi:MAG TPA: hypothetical protein VME66_03810, partial [Candidatus Acidoferrales bacterium]|nr:hypothetical protein [Candidatus Acidoferrales bacterium]
QSRRHRIKSSPPFLGARSAFVGRDNGKRQEHTGKRQGHIDHFEVTSSLESTIPSSFARLPG